MAQTRKRYVPLYARCIQVSLVVVLCVWGGGVDGEDG